MNGNVAPERKYLLMTGRKRRVNGEFCSASQFCFAGEYPKLSRLNISYGYARSGDTSLEARTSVCMIHFALQVNIQNCLD